MLDSGFELKERVEELVMTIECPFKDGPLFEQIEERYDDVMDVLHDVDLGMAYLVENEFDWWLFNDKEYLDNLVKIIKWCDQHEKYISGEEEFYDFYDY